MTGYTVHTGTSKKFVSGWDKVFGDTPKEKSKSKASRKEEASKSKSSTKKK